MFRRPVPAPLWWLAALVALAIGSAVATLAVIYAETRSTARTQAQAMTGGSATAGSAAISRYACGACHVIPGIAGAAGKAAPDLTHVGKRAALAGSLSNDPATMAAWIAHPQRLRPGSAMPEMGVTPTEARDISAYLYAQN